MSRTHRGKIRAFRVALLRYLAKNKFIAVSQNTREQKFTRRGEWNANSDSRKNSVLWHRPEAAKCK